MTVASSKRILVRPAVVAIGLLVMLATSMPAVALVEPERVEIPSLGLAATMPEGWHHTSAETHRENLRRLADDPDRQALLLRSSSTPVIAFAKYPEPYDGLNPSFRVTVRPAGTMQGRSALDILNQVLPSMQQILDGVEAEQNPVETQISGHTAAYGRLSYRIRIGESEYPAISEVWIVPRGADLFIIGAGRSLDESAQTRAEIQTILDTIVIR